MLVGDGAKGLSPAALGRLKAQLSEEYQGWSRRKLADSQYAHWWVDGIDTPLRESDDPRLYLLVIIGMRRRHEGVGGHRRRVAPRDVQSVTLHWPCGLPWDMLDATPFHQTVVHHQHKPSDAAVTYLGEPEDGPAKPFKPCQPVSVTPRRVNRTIALDRTALSETPVPQSMSTCGYVNGTAP